MIYSLQLKERRKMEIYYVKEAFNRGASLAIVNKFDK